MPAATTETLSEALSGLANEGQELVLRHSNDSDTLQTRFSRQALCGLIGGNEQRLRPLLLVGVALLQQPPLEVIRALGH